MVVIIGHVGATGPDGGWTYISFHAEISSLFEISAEITSPSRKVMRTLCLF